MKFLSLLLLLLTQNTSLEEIFEFLLIIFSLYKNEYIEDINSDVTYIFCFICCLETTWEEQPRES